MLYVKTISYILSHIFFLIFTCLFIPRRYSNRKTFTICLFSCLLMTLMDYFKLHLHSDSPVFYFFTTIAQIAITQLTALFLSEKRTVKTLFLGLSASNYILVGTIFAPILYLFTGCVSLALVGNLLAHLVILAALYRQIGDIVSRFCERELDKNKWELCLIPVFFYCSFSSIAFFPHTLYEHPENILVCIFLMITMLVSYMVVFRYMDSEAKQVEEYWKNVMFESYIKGLESQSYLVGQSERNLKILRHDMRHYSMTIDSLLNQKEYEEIRNITGHIKEVVDENRIPRYCENLVVNTVLTTMTEQAQSFQIALLSDITIPREIPVNEYEFAMVLANLLENAMRSVKTLEPDSRSINVKVHCNTEHLLIDMENECAQEIFFDSTTGLPKSRQGKGHGLGMQSVQAFCDKLNGTIDCYCENNRFRIIMFVKF